MRDHGIIHRRRADLTYAGSVDPPCVIHDDHDHLSVTFLLKELESNSSLFRCVRREIFFAPSSPSPPLLDLASISDHRGTAVEGPVQRKQLPHACVHQVMAACVHPRANVAVGTVNSATSAQLSAKLGANPLSSQWPSCVHLEGYLGWPPTESPNQCLKQPVHVNIRGSAPALALQYFDRRCSCQDISSLFRCVHRETSFSTSNRDRARQRRSWR